MKKFILVLILLIYLIFNYDYLRFYSVNNKNDKFKLIKNKYLSSDYCDKLSNIILNQSLKKSNVLSDAFESSYGILIKFKDNNQAKKIFDKNNLTDIYNLFKKIKKPDCNAFVFNSLIINSNKSKEIESHYDNTLSIKHGLLNRDILPKWVTVIYIKLPKKFTGGKLLLNNFSNFNFYYPKCTIIPEVGKLVQFRGDAYHLVEEIKANLEDYRISLVFEQYQIGNIDFPFYVNI